MPLARGRMAKIAGFRNPRGHELVRGSMGDQPTISSHPCEACQRFAQIPATKLN